MANKHERQRDFYARQRQFRDSLKFEKKEEILFDEELYPEFKDGNETRTYYNKDDKKTLNKIHGGR